MGYWDDIKNVFATLVAGRGASHQAQQTPPAAATSENQSRNDIEILQRLNAAVEHTETALKGAAHLEARRNIVAIAVRDGTGAMRTVLIEKSEINKVLDFARQRGRSATTMATLGALGKGLQVIDLAVKFSEPEVYKGIDTLIRASRDPSRSWNTNSQRQLEEMFADEAPPARPSLP